MFLDLLEKATDAEKDYKGQMELIAENKNNADKTRVYQSNSLRQGESAPDRLQVIAAILLANSRIYKLEMVDLIILMAKLVRFGSGITLAVRQKYQAFDPGP